MKVSGSDCRGATVFIAVLLMTCPAWATDWYVSPEGKSTNPGTQKAPWDLAGALIGQGGQVKAGDTINLLDGTYVIDRKLTHAAQTILLTGTKDQPIIIRPAPGARARIDGGLAMGRYERDTKKRSEHVWIRDLEIFVSEWIKPVVSKQQGSWPGDVPHAAGGLHAFYGAQCKYINLVIHNTQQGMSVWEHEENPEIYGCIVYENGWVGPDRAHGHCIYTQNREGRKVYSDNILCVRNPQGQSSMNIYSSGDNGWTNHFTVTRNIAYGGGKLLVGGGRPSEGMQVIGNLLYKTPLWNGYFFSDHNIEFEVRDNLVVGDNMHFFNIQKLQDSNNTVIDGSFKYYKSQKEVTTKDGSPRPDKPIIRLMANRYDKARANLVIFKWDAAKTVPVDFAAVVPAGGTFKLMDPKDFFGKPVHEGVVDAAGKAEVPTPAEFNVFVVLANAAPQAASKPQ